jgi:hypothetical protein
MSHFDITIITLTNKRLTINVNSNDTIKELREKINREAGDESGYNNIILEGKALSNSKTIDESNIKKGSIIYIVLPRRGRFHKYFGDKSFDIFIDFMNGEKIKFNINPHTYFNDFLKDIMIKYYELFPELKLTEDIQIYNPQLINNDKILNYSEYIRDYYNNAIEIGDFIKENNTIRLILDSDLTVISHRDLIILTYTKILRNIKKFPLLKNTSITNLSQQIDEITISKIENTLRDKKILILLLVIIINNEESDIYDNNINYINELKKRINALFSLS